MRYFVVFVCTAVYCVTAAPIEDSTQTENVESIRQTSEDQIVNGQIRQERQFHYPYFRNGLQIGAQYPSIEQYQPIAQYQPFSQLGAQMYNPYSYGYPLYQYPQTNYVRNYLEGSGSTYGTSQFYDKGICVKKGNIYVCY
ncbi:uncharacterized protein LOC136034909 [Artemia franciscana]|uniref:Uncharacterized protein n=1 Tax=Artemia franciscana TaxID=6661 RepID=A0AA88IEM6_ARTSF|nr:hypothetical protein QYM36_003168 [Artemia franciscana]